MCSPSRRAFLSGRLPIHHSEALSPTRSDDLDLRWTTIGQKLESVGYRSFWWGKGHTGYMSWRHLPSNLGFSAGFYGFLAANQPHSQPSRWQDSHIVEAVSPTDGVSAPFSTYDYGRRIVRHHGQSDPLAVPQLALWASSARPRRRPQRT